LLASLPPPQMTVISTSGTLPGISDYIESTYLLIFDLVFRPELLGRRYEEKSPGTFLPQIGFSALAHSSAGPDRNWVYHRDFDDGSPGGRYRPNLGQYASVFDLDPTICDPR
jgi:hypothetical protein